MRIRWELLVDTSTEKVHAPKQVFFYGIKLNLQNAKIRHALHSTWENSAFEKIIA